ncbi:glycoside hydrolase family 36 N-terminal domain-containing protein [Tunturiibacter gelidiferens]|uniref:glycoside hydrolase family 36 N-terminal domain-containing protein n=1 Tax=Tunturiibacter gelidiferens TaxID=3069689 RepID=UPI003D9B3AB4
MLRPSIHRSQQRRSITSVGGGPLRRTRIEDKLFDGNRDLVLRYASHSIKGNELTVTSRYRDLFVGLHYRVDETTGIIARSSSVINRTHEPLVIAQASAATWNLSLGTDYFLHYLTGRWGRRGHPSAPQDFSGETILESRRGSTGHHRRRTLRPVP